MSEFAGDAMAWGIKSDFFPSSLPPSICFILFRAMRAFSQISHIHTHHWGSFKHNAWACLGTALIHLLVVFL